MRKGDLVWAAALAAAAALLLAPATRGPFMDFTAAHPYLSSFAKFLVLATMGELLARRIVAGRWSAPPGLAWRSLVWGLLGMAVVLVFELFSGGVKSAMAKGLLPWEGSQLAYAFFVGSIMNLTFGPTMMLAHRMADTCIDLGCEARREGRRDRPTLATVVERIDWKGFVSFTLFKTIPLFWIPAHTLTFLLPPEYRILAAAFLSMALGAILAFGKRAPRGDRA